MLGLHGAVDPTCMQMRGGGAGVSPGCHLSDISPPCIHPPPTILLLPQQGERAPKTLHAAPKSKSPGEFPVRFNGRVLHLTTFSEWLHNQGKHLGETNKQINEAPFHGSLKTTRLAEPQTVWALDCGRKSRTPVLILDIPSGPSLGLLKHLGNGLCNGFKPITADNKPSLSHGQ